MNRFLSAMICLGCALGAASAQTSRPSAADDKRTTPTTPALTIPSGAVANSDGTWSYTDKQGKSWTYAKTPFGVSRAPATAAAKVPVLKGIPKDAVRSADGSYLWTDKDGKPWTLVNTPFGVSRTPFDSVPAAEPASTSDVKAIDKGDTVRFERQSPMGPMAWEKKKADLTAEERRVYEAQNPQAQK